MTHQLSIMYSLRGFLKDSVKKPEVVPVMAIALVATGAARYFMSWKMFNTPDVHYNIKAAEPNYESYKGQPQKPFNVQSKVL